MDKVLTEVSCFRCFKGFQRIFAHESKELKCTMRFGIYLPDLNPDEKAPVLLYLSGLTCTESNFIEKSGFQRYASAMKMIVVNADTSPRGVDIEGDSDCWDFGKGAGFYVDAQEPKWRDHYRMYSYVSEELPLLVESNFTQCDGNRWAIFGHSMGGHGAIVIGLRKPEKFKSISAFAPICNPVNCPWGKKAFQGYLGADIEKWKEYDSVEIAKSYSGPPRKILIDQGVADKFLVNGQLLPKNIEAVSSEKVNFEVRYHEQYDHSYYFIASFIEDHFRFHQKHLSS